MFRYFLVCLMVIPMLHADDSSERTLLKIVKLKEVSDAQVDSTNHVDRYLNFLKTHSLGPNGSYKSGEIEIITDAVKIRTIEGMAKARLKRAGYTDEAADDCSRVGIIAEDQYWIWIRDAVIFPSGFEGTYNRVLWRNHLTGPASAVAVPIFADGRIGVLLNFRHATRSWEIQLPAGLREPSEAPEMAARRELEEETGCEVGKLELLGHISPDSGMTPTTIPMYIGYVEKVKKNKPDLTEAIHRLCLLSQEELSKAVIEGSITMPVNGKPTKVKCSDPSLAYLLQHLSKK